MKTAVICAMRRELDAITAEMENVSVSRQRGFEIFTGELYGKSVAACLSGVGKAYAAAATAVLIERFSPEIIINSGVAGGAPGLKKGEVFIAERAAEHDYSVPDEPVRFFEADASLVEDAVCACKEEGCAYRKGVIASGDRFVTGEKEVARLQSVFGADAFDMECAAVMKICAFAGVKALCVRAISDNGDDDGMESYYEFLDSSSRQSAAIVKKLIKMH